MPPFYRDGSAESRQLPVFDRLVAQGNGFIAANAKWPSLIR
jgi:hypothetical protein